MKLLKSWKLMLLFSIILVYSIFGSYVFSKESSLPSEGFSRHIELTSIKTENFQDSRNASTITSFNLDNGNIGVLYYDNTLNYIEYSKDAEILKKVDLDLTFHNLTKLKFKDIENDNLVFYAINASELHSYSVNLTNKNVDKKVVYKDIISMKSSDNYIFIVNKNGFVILDNRMDTHQEVYKSNHKARRVSNLIDNGNLCFSYLANDEKGIQKLWYYSYTASNNESKTINITTIPSSGNYSTSSLSFLKNDNFVRILHEGSDYKTGTSTLTVYEGELENNANSDVKNIDSHFTKIILSGLKSANNSKLISSNTNDFEFIARLPNKESNSQIAHDIYMFRYEDNKPANAKKLTRTRGNSANPSYLKSPSGNYLLWTDSIGLDKRILIAGDNENIINISSKLSSYDKNQLLMNIIFTLSPTLFTFLVPLLSIAGPVIFILIVLSFTNLTYLERNGKKILPIIILIHLILKFRFIYNTLFETMPHIRAVLPLYINNIYILSLFIIILTILSLWIIYLKNPKFLEGRDIWMSYISFMLIDILLVWLAIMPYIYMWLNVTPNLSGGFMSY